MFQLIKFIYIKEINNTIIYIDNQKKICIYLFIYSITYGMNLKHFSLLYNINNTTKKIKIYFLNFLFAHINKYHLLNLKYNLDKIDQKYYNQYFFQYYF